MLPLLPCQAQAEVRLLQQQKQPRDIAREKRSMNDSSCLRLQAPHISHALHFFKKTSGVSVLLRRAQICQ
jgi:hypothetical protein